jgi:hypothetical protein
VSAIYFAAIPACPVHGRMHADGPEGWSCAGWDGEGCDYRAAPDWQLLGEVDGLEAP